MDNNNQEQVREVSFEELMKQFQDFDQLIEKGLIEIETEGKFCIVKKYHYHPEDPAQKILAVPLRLTALDVERRFYLKQEEAILKLKNDVLNAEARLAEAEDIFEDVITPLKKAVMKALGKNQ